MTTTTPEPLDMLLAARDESGLLPPCCHTAFLDGWLVGRSEGHAAGRQEVLDGIDASVAQVIRGAVKGIDVRAARRRPYVVPAWATPRPGVRS